MRETCGFIKQLTALSAAILLLSLSLLSQQPGREDVPRSHAGYTPESADLRSRYILGPEDQIVIHALNVPDVSDKPLRVDMNGDIKMPMVGRMQAGGLTIEQLEAEITKRLKVYLEEPDVAVSISEFHSQPVSIIGEVATPGVHQVQGRKTLVEILSLAGGIRPDAGPNIRITRRLEWGRVPLPGAVDDPTGKYSIAEVNLKSLLEAKTPENNIIVRSQDIISVPRAEIVFVMGEVGKAGPLALNEAQTVSILQAIASSGGLLRTAASRHAKILRPIMGGPKRAELAVDIKRILNGQANDVPLLAGDILFVPGSNSKRVTARALESALQAGTLMATYGIVR